MALWMGCNPADDLIQSVEICGRDCALNVYRLILFASICDLYAVIGRHSVQLMMDTDDVHVYGHCVLSFHCVVHGHDCDCGSVEENISAVMEAGNALEEVHDMAVCDIVRALEVSEVHSLYGLVHDGYPGDGDGSQVVAIL